MEATEQYFPVVFVMLYKVVLTIESVGQILKCELWCGILPKVGLNYHSTYNQLTVYDVKGW